MSNKRIKS